nr:hypothetical protein CFP56_62712 [Quercus suber]
MTFAPCMIFIIRLRMKNESDVYLSGSAQSGDSRETDRLKADEARRSNHQPQRPRNLMILPVTGFHRIVLASGWENQVSRVQ